MSLVPRSFTASASKRTRLHARRDSHRANKAQCSRPRDTHDRSSAVQRESHTWPMTAPHTRFPNVAVFALALTLAVRQLISVYLLCLFCAGPVGVCVPCPGN